MNPLRLHLPAANTGSKPALPVPGLAEIQAWLVSQQDLNAKQVAPALQGLLHGINSRQIPIRQRLQTLSLLQPKVRDIVHTLRGHYRSQPLPLNDKVRGHAELARLLLTEITLGYKLLVNEAVCHSADDDLDSNMFLIALRQTIEELGQLLLECSIQYARVPDGSWGEIHRLYQFADRNGLSTLAITPPAEQDKPLTTILHTYLRVVMMALTQPHHLMNGQAEMIYLHLEQWTVGCRLERRATTEAGSGDLFVDLASDNPPVVATGYMRFRPIDGRFIDITPLQQRLAELRSQLDAATPGTLPGGTTVPLDERLRRDMLLRLCKAWEGRGERQAPRMGDRHTPLLMSIGLDPAHYFVSAEQDFTPEQDEIRLLQLWGTEPGGAPGLRLSQADQTLLQRLAPQEKTRVSQFDAGHDVWTQMHNRDLKARDQRRAALARYCIEPWVRINHSLGGLAARRTAPCRSHFQVGGVLAFRDDNTSADWRLGMIRWVQDNGADGYDIGIKTLSYRSTPVAVRAFIGAGAGGEYFRSLLIDLKHAHETESAHTTALAVPAYIYDVHTQLVVNRGERLEFVQLTALLETTSTFSVFAFQPSKMTLNDHQAIITTLADRH